MQKDLNCNLCDVDSSFAHSPGQKGPCPGTWFQGVSPRLSSGSAPHHGVTGLQCHGDVPTSPSRIVCVFPRLKILCPNFSEPTSRAHGRIFLSYPIILMEDFAQAPGAGKWWRCCWGWGCEQRKGSGLRPLLPCFCMELHRVWEFGIGASPSRWIWDIFPS